MKSRHFLFVILLVSVSQLFALSDTLPVQLGEMVAKGKKAIYLFQFDAARQTFREMKAAYPEYPHGYFYSAYLTALLYSQDKSNDSLEADLLEEIELAIERGEAYAEASDDSPEAQFYLGLSHGVLGLYYVLDKSYVQAYLNGRKAKNYLEKLVKTAPDYYDAYLGLGVYHYYLDLMPGLVKFFAGILGFHGDRALGLREIQTTAAKGTFFSVEARFIEATLRYFLQGEKQQMLPRFYQLDGEFPGNPITPLLIGYHYRRRGKIEKAIPYFQSVRDDFKAELPQVFVMKYFNIGVCLYRLNALQKADSVFAHLQTAPVRKTPYYLAGIAYYRGLIADLQFKRSVAERFYAEIPKNKHTQYYYNISRINVLYPMDEALRLYYLAENAIYRANFPEAVRYVAGLEKIYQRKRSGYSVPFMPVLIKDLQGRLYFRQGAIRKAAEHYRDFIEHVRQVTDDFYRAWIYIQYARILREQQKWQQAESVLELAEKCDDEYTKLIINRERFLLKNHRTG
ncbi:MAG: hypothetical protein Kow0037_00260 [Calditrichia bacterium]